MWYEWSGFKTGKRGLFMWETQGLITPWYSNWEKYFLNRCFSIPLNGILRLHLWARPYGYYMIRGVLMPVDIWSLDTVLSTFILKLLAFNLFFIVCISLYFKPIYCIVCTHPHLDSRCFLPVPPRLTCRFCGGRFSVYSHFCWWLVHGTSGNALSSALSFPRYIRWGWSGCEADEHSGRAKGKPVCAVRVCTGPRARNAGPTRMN